MDAPSAESQDSLFFHLQRNPVRHYRRVRKEPEELPQALRYFKYANLNPRIAAFLGKQDPKSLLKRSKTGGGKREDGKEGPNTAPNGGLMGGEFGNDLSQEARRLLPEIGQGMRMGGMGMFGDDAFGQSRLSFNNEIDDPQRYQFEETTFAAPNILRELADILTKFNDSFAEYVHRTTLYDPDTGDPMPTENTSPSVMLPAGVTNLLNQTWDEVVSETIYTNRVWQTAAYKAAYNFNTAAASGKQEPSQIPTENVTSSAPALHAGKQTAAASLKPELKSIVDLLDETRAKAQSKREDRAESRASADKKKTKGLNKDAILQNLAVPQKSKAKTGEDRNARIEDSSKKSSKQALPTTSRVYGAKQSRTGIKAGQSGGKKSSKSNFGGGNLLPIPEERRRRSIVGTGRGKDWAMRSNISIQDGGSPEKLQRHQTLSFNLTSKKAMDEGWIVKTKPDPDMEQNNVLEWATNRLQSAIKQREDEDEQAKSTGNIKPVVIRYYGDSRRDTLLKLYRKGNENDGKAAAVAAGLLPGRKSAGAVLKIPQLSKMESSEKERFMVQVPDGSITVYYPHNGNVAIMASAVPNAPGQLYVNCYANDESRTCLATFTPYGKSCCYHKNGTPGLILTDGGGLLKTEDGSVQKKWEWPREGLKLKDHVVFHLNKEMYVRVLNKGNVTLNFTANRETAKIPVGALPGASCPTGPVENTNVLRSGLRLSSKTAGEYQPGMRSAKDDKSRASKLRKYGIRKTTTQSRRCMEIDDLKRSLEPPERFEFESQADRELQRLQNKSKLLVDEWMDHYRTAVGISSPALKKLLDTPLKPKTTPRKVQSARERKVTEDDDDFVDRGTKFQSFRSPSAPPKHMLPGPHSIAIMDERLRRHLPSAMAGPASKKGADTHVRIDDAPTDAKSTAREQLSQRTPSTGASRQRPHTHGSRSTLRPQRSSLRTSSSASSSAAKSPEKRWTPAPECCPVVTRNTILQSAKNPDKVFTCKCSKHRIPLVHDLELDYFLRMVAPSAQLIVICVVNSLYPEASPYDTMFDKLYIDRNKNRSKPCSQSRHDQYRILRYDLAVAKIGSSRPSPLLLGRHNVVPGMTLMYCGGRLLFADHIFNGYGNARNDFRKQVFRSKKEFLLGHFLPDDFRFTPGTGKPGFRAAWGGEMGGAGVGGKGAPGMFFTNHTIKAKSAGFQPNVAPPVDETRSEGDVTSDTTVDLKMQTSKSFDTARDFVQYTLSTRMYVIPPQHKRSGTRVDERLRSTATSRFPLNATYPPAGATPLSAVNEDGSLRPAPLNSFVRMQAVK